MARIVPGYPEPPEPGQAVLAGFQGARKLRLEEQQAQQAMQLRQMQLMLQMQDASVRHAYQKAKTQELLNERAAAGDRAAVQDLMMQAQMSPDQMRAQDIAGVWEEIKKRTSDPDLLDDARQNLIGLEKEFRAQQQRSVAAQAIERAGANGDIDPMQYKTRLDSGESPDVLTKELQQIETKKNISGMAEKHSQEAIAQAESLVEGLPKGSRQRLAAEFTLKRFADSLYDQQQPGAATKMLEEVQKAALGSERDFQEQQFREQVSQLPLMAQDAMARSEFERSRKTGKASPLGLPAGMKAGPKGTGPDGTGESPSGPFDEWIPSDRERAAYGGRSIGQSVPHVVYRAIEETRSREEFKQALRDAGLDISDRNVLAEVKRAMEARNDVAANAGAADR